LQCRNDSNSVTWESAASLVRNVDEIIYDTTAESLILILDTSGSIVYVSDKNFIEKSMIFMPLTLVVLFAGKSLELL